MLPPEQAWRNRNCSFDFDIICLKCGREPWKKIKRDCKIGYVYQNSHLFPQAGG